MNRTYSREDVKNMTEDELTAALMQEFAILEYHTKRLVRAAFYFGFATALAGAIIFYYFIM